MKLRTRYKKLKQRYAFMKNAKVMPQEVLIATKPIIKLKAAATCDELYYREPWMDDAMERELATRIIKQLLESRAMQTVTRYEHPNYIREATLMVIGGENGRFN